MRQGGTSIFDVFPRLQNQPGWPRLGSLEFMKLGQAVLSLQRGLLEIELKDSSLKRVLFSSSSKSSRLASRVMVATTLAGKGKFLEAKQFPDVRSQFQVISPTHCRPEPPAAVLKKGCNCNQELNRLGVQQY